MIIKKLLLGAFILGMPLIAHSQQSISHGICQQNKNVLLNAIYPYRMQGVPIENAFSVFSSETNQGFKAFLFATVTAIYQNPEVARTTIDSPEFMELCVSAHRGY